jgi:hypothetical protein
MSVELDIEIRCKECGYDLKAEFINNRIGYPEIIVEPCIRCAVPVDTDLSTTTKTIKVKCCKECPYREWDWAGNDMIDVYRCGQTETIITTPDNTIPELCPLGGI